jgi:hypothetical protein
VGASQRHTGKSGTGYTYKPSLSSLEYGMFITDYFVRIEGIELDFSGISVDSAYLSLITWAMGAPVNISKGEIRLDSLLVHGGTVTGTGNGGLNGITLQLGNSIVTNCIIYDLTVTNTANTSVVGLMENQYNTTHYWYNNTIYDIAGVNSNVQGMHRAYGTIYAKNNYVGDITASGTGTASCYAGTYAADSTNNASSDDTGDDGNLAPGVTGANSYSSYFTNITAGSEDLHLKTTDTILKNQGADLSADTGYTVTVDIDGAGRVDGSYDIGADEAPRRVYYSVGTNTN